MTIYDLKPAFQKLLTPIVVSFHKRSVTPNQVTIFTCIMSLVYSFGLSQNIENKYWLMSIPFFLFLRMALNAIDGVLAKKFNLISPLGAILNEITDVIADTAFFAAFLLHSRINSPLLLLFIFGAFLTEMTGLSALHLKSPRRFDGPMGKSDRAFVFGLLALLLALTPITPFLVSIVLLTLILLIGLTIKNRIQNALKINAEEIERQTPHQA